MAPAARSIGRAIGALVLFGAALGVLLELTARVFLFGIAGLDPRRIDSVRGLDTAGLVRRSEHPELGFELEPHVDTLFKLVPFRTNSRGLRDREYALEKPPGTLRVAVLGSSLTLPSGVAIEDAFHTRLEERFGRELAPTAVEFINFAVGAYVPTQALAMLRLRALDYDPDLVLFAAPELAGPLLAQGGAARPFRDLWPTSGRSPFFRSFFLALLETRWRSEPTAAPDPRRVGPRTSDLLRDGDEGDVIEQLGEIARDRGIPIVLVRLGFDPGEVGPIDREIERKARAAGLHFVDTRPAFAGTRFRDFWIYELDPHPNARAHEIFADVLARFLRERRLLVP